MRLDSNDYSVHPSVIGRRIEVTAALDRVRVACDSQVVADHERVWARHQTITDPEHLAAARALRRERLEVIRPAAGPQVEIRRLADYDARAHPAQGRLDGRRSQAAARDVTAELAFLTGALKAPTLREAVPRRAARARSEAWSHEEFLAACLHEVARESHGARAASVPPGSRPASRWRTSISTMPARGARSSLTWAPWTSSPAKKS